MAEPILDAPSAPPASPYLDPANLFTTQDWVEGSAESRKQQADKFLSRAVDAVQNDGEYRFKADIYKNGKAEPEEVRANNGKGVLSDHGTNRLLKMRDYLESAVTSPDGGFFLNSATGKYEAKQDTEAALKLTPRGEQFPDVVGYKASLERGIQEEGVPAKPSYRGYAEWKNSQVGVGQLDPNDKAMEKAYDSHEAFTSFDPNSMGQDEPVRKVEGKLVFNPAFAMEPKKISDAINSLPDLSGTERALGQAQLKKEQNASTLYNQDMTRWAYDFISKDDRATQNALKSVSDDSNGDRLLEKTFDITGQLIGDVVGGGLEIIGSNIKSLFTGKEASKGAVVTGTLDNVLQNGDLIKERDRVAGRLATAKISAVQNGGGEVEVIEARLKVMNELVDQFAGKGITDGKVMGQVLQDAAKEHVWANGTEDKVRTLSDGRIALKKEAVAERDPNTILRLIESQETTPGLISRAKETYLQNRDYFAANLNKQMLRNDEDYRAYVDSSKETDPAKLIFGWSGSNTGKMEATGDWIGDVATQGGRGIMGAFGSVRAASDDALGTLADKIGLDGVSSWYKKGAAQAVTNMIERGKANEYDEALAEIRGERGPIAKTMKGGVETVEEMAPMFVGGIGGGALKLVKGATTAAKVIRGVGEAAQIGGVYGYPGVQGMQSIYESALQKAEEKASLEGRELNDKDKIGVIHDNWLPAVSLGVETIVGQMLFNSGSKNVALNTIGRTDTNLTMREMVSQLAKRAEDGTFQTAFKGLKPEIGGMLKKMGHHGISEVMDESLNQISQGLIERASIDPDKKFSEIGGETIQAALTAFVIGSGSPMLGSAVTRNNQADHQQAMQYVTARQLMRQANPEDTAATSEMVNQAGASMAEVTSLREDYQLARSENRFTDAKAINDQITQSLDTLRENNGIEKFERVGQAHAYINEEAVHVAEMLASDTISHEEKVKALIDGALGQKGNVETFAEDAPRKQYTAENLEIAARGTYDQLLQKRDGVPAVLAEDGAVETVARPGQPLNEEEQTTLAALEPALTGETVDHAALAEHYQADLMEAAPAEQATPVTAPEATAPQGIFTPINQKEDLHLPEGDHGVPWVMERLLGPAPTDRSYINTQGEQGSVSADLGKPITTSVNSTAQLVTLSNQENSVPSGMLFKTPEGSEYVPLAEGIQRLKDSGVKKAVKEASNLEALSSPRNVADAVQSFTTPNEASAQEDVPQTNAPAGVDAPPSATSVASVTESAEASTTSTSEPAVAPALSPTNSPSPAAETASPPPVLKAGDAVEYVDSKGNNVQATLMKPSDGVEPHLVKIDSNGITKLKSIPLSRELNLIQSPQTTTQNNGSQENSNEEVLSENSNEVSDGDVREVPAGQEDGQSGSPSLDGKGQEEVTPSAVAGNVPAAALSLQDIGQDEETQSRIDMRYLPVGSIVTHPGYELSPGRLLPFRVRNSPKLDKEGNVGFQLDDQTTARTMTSFIAGFSVVSIPQTDEVSPKWLKSDSNYNPAASTQAVGQDPKSQAAFDKMDLQPGTTVKHQYNNAGSDPVITGYPTHDKLNGMLYPVRYPNGGKGQLKAKWITSVLNVPVNKTNALEPSSTTTTQETPAVTPPSKADEARARLKAKFNAGTVNPSDPTAPQGNLSIGAIDEETLIDMATVAVDYLKKGAHTVAKMTESFAKDVDFKDLVSLVKEHGAKIMEKAKELYLAATVEKPTVYQKVHDTSLPIYSLNESQLREQSGTSESPDGFRLLPGTHSTTYSYTAPKGKVLPVTMGDTLAVEGDPESVLVLREVVSKLGGQEYYFTKVKMDTLMDFDGNTYKGNSLVNKAWNKSRLQPAAMAISGNLDQLKGGNQEDVKKFFTRLFTTIAPSMSVQEVVFGKIDGKTPMRMSAEERTLADGRTEIVPVFHVDPKVMAARIQERLKNFDVSGMGETDQKFFNNLASMELAREHAATINEELLHAVTLKSFDYDDLRKFYDNAQGSPILMDALHGIALQRLGKDILEGAEEGKFNEALNFNREELVQVVGEAMRKFHELSNNGITAEGQLASSRAFFEMMANPGKGVLAKKMEVVAQMLKRYAEKIRQVLTMQAVQNRLPDTHREMLRQLNAAYKAANILGDVDFVRDKAAQKEEAKQEKIKTAAMEYIQDIAREQTEGASALRRVSDLFVNLNFDDLVHLDFKEMKITLKPQVIDYIEKNKLDVDMEAVEKALNAFNDAGTLAQTTAMLVQNERTLLARRAALDFDPSGLFSSSDFARLGNYDYRLMAHILASAPNENSALFSNLDNQIKDLRDESKVAEVMRHQSALVRLRALDPTQGKDLASIMRVALDLGFLETETFKDTIQTPFAQEYGWMNKMVNFIEKMPSLHEDLAKALGVEPRYLEKSAELKSQIADALKMRDTLMEVKGYLGKGQAEIASRIEAEKLNPSDGGYTLRLLQAAQGVDPLVSDARVGQYEAYVAALSEFNDSVRNAGLLSIGQDTVDKTYFGTRFLDFNQMRAVEDQGSFATGTSMPEIPDVGFKEQAHPTEMGRVVKVYDYNAVLGYPVNNPQAENSQQNVQSKSPVHPNANDSAEIRKLKFDYQQAISNNAHALGRKMFISAMADYGTGNVPAGFDSERYFATAGFNASSTRNEKFNQSTYASPHEIFPRFSFDGVFDMEEELEKLNDLSPAKQIELLTRYNEQLGRMETWALQVQEAIGEGAVLDLNGRQTLAGRFAPLLQKRLFEFIDPLMERVKVDPVTRLSVSMNQMSLIENLVDELSKPTPSEAVIKDLKDRAFGRGSSRENLVTGLRLLNTDVRYAREALREFNNTFFRENMDKEVSRVSRDPSFEPTSEEFLKFRERRIDFPSVENLGFYIQQLSESHNFRMGATYAIDLQQQHAAIQYSKDGNQLTSRDEGSDNYIDPETGKKAYFRRESNEKAEMTRVDSRDEQGYRSKAFDGNTSNSREDLQLNGSRIDRTIDSPEQQLRKWITKAGMLIGAGNGGRESARSFLFDSVNLELAPERGGLEDLMVRGVSGLFNDQVEGIALNELVDEFKQANPSYTSESSRRFDAETFFRDLIDFKAGKERSHMERSQVKDGSLILRAISTVANHAVAAERNNTLTPEGTITDGRTGVTEESFTDLADLYRQKTGRGMFDFAFKHSLFNSAEESAAIAKGLRAALSGSKDSTVFHADRFIGADYLAGDDAGIISAILAHLPNTLVYTPETAELREHSIEAGMRFFEGRNGEPNVIFAPQRQNKGNTRSEKDAVLSQVLVMLGQSDPEIASKIEKIGQTAKQGFESLQAVVDVANARGLDTNNHELQKALMEVVKGNVNLSGAMERAGGLESNAKQKEFFTALLKHLNDSGEMFDSYEKFKRSMVVVNAQGQKSRVEQSNLATRNPSGIDTSVLGSDGNALSENAMLFSQILTNPKLKQFFDLTTYFSEPAVQSPLNENTIIALLDGIRLAGMPMLGSEREAEVEIEKGNGLSSRIGTRQIVDNVLFNPSEHATVALGFAEAYDAASREALPSDTLLFNALSDIIGISRGMQQQAGQVAGRSQGIDEGGRKLKQRSILPRDSLRGEVNPVYNPEDQTRFSQEYGGNWHNLMTPSVGGRLPQTHRYAMQRRTRLETYMIGQLPSVIEMIEQGYQVMGRNQSVIHIDVPLDATRISEIRAMLPEGLFDRHLDSVKAGIASLQENKTATLAEIKTFQAFRDALLKNTANAVPTAAMLDDPKIFQGVTRKLVDTISDLAFNRSSRLMGQVDWIAANFKATQNNYSADYKAIRDAVVSLEAARVGEVDSPAMKNQVRLAIEMHQNHLNGVLRGMLAEKGVTIPVGKDIIQFPKLKDNWSNQDYREVLQSMKEVFEQPLANRILNGVAQATSKESGKELVETLKQVLGTDEKLKGRKLSKDQSKAMSRTASELIEAARSQSPKEFETTVGEKLKGLLNGSELDQQGLTRLISQLAMSPQEKAELVNFAEQRQAEAAQGSNQPLMSATRQSQRLAVENRLMALGANLDQINRSLSAMNRTSDDKAKIGAFPFMEGSEEAATSTPALLNFVSPAQDQVVQDEDIYNQMMVATPRPPLENYIHKTAVFQALHDFFENHAESTSKMLKGDRKYFNNYNPFQMIQDTLENIKVENEILSQRFEEFESGAALANNQQEIKDLQLDYFTALTDPGMGKDILQVAKDKRIARYKANKNSDARKQQLGRLIDSGDGPVLLMARSAKEDLRLAFAQAGKDTRTVDESLRGMILNAASMPQPGKPDTYKGYNLGFSDKDRNALSSLGSKGGDFAWASGLSRQEVGKQLADRFIEKSNILMDSKRLQGRSGPRVDTQNGIGKDMADMYRELIGKIVEAYDFTQNGQKVLTADTLKKIGAMLIPINSSEGLKTLDDMRQLDVLTTYARVFADVEGTRMGTRMIAGLSDLGPARRFVAENLDQEDASIRRYYAKDLEGRNEVRRLLGYLQGGFDQGSGRQQHAAKMGEIKQRFADASKGIGNVIGKGKLSREFGGQWMDYTSAHILSSLQGTLDLRGGSVNDRLARWYEDFRKGVSASRILEHGNNQMGRLKKSVSAQHMSLLDEKEGLEAVSKVVDKRMTDYFLLSSSERTDLSAETLIEAIGKDLMKGSKKETEILHYAKVLRESFKDLHDSAEMMKMWMSFEELDTSEDGLKTSMHAVTNTYTTAPLNFIHAANPAATSVNRQGGFTPDKWNLITLNKSKVFGGGPKENGEVLRPMLLNGLSSPVSIFDDTLKRLYVAPNYFILRKLIGKQELDANNQAKFTGNPLMTTGKVLQELGRHGKKVLENAVRPAAIKLETELSNMFGGGVEDTELAKVARIASNIYTFKKLVSVQQTFNQAVGPLLGIAAGKISLLKFAELKRFMAVYADGVASNLGAASLPNWAGGGRLQARADVQNNWVESISPLSFFRHANGMDPIQSQLGKVVPYGQGVIGKTKDLMGGQAADWIDAGLEWSIGKTERRITTAMFISEAFNQLQLAAASGEIDRAPASIKEMLKMGPRQIPNIVKERAGIEANDTMGGSDSVKKAKIFQNLTKNATIDSILRSTVRFTTQNMWMASNSSVAAEQLGSQDPGIRDEARELFIRTMTQQMLFAFTKIGTLTPLMIFLGNLLSGDDPEDAAEKAQQQSNKLLLAQKKDPMLVKLAKNLVFGDAPELFDSRKAGHEALVSATVHTVAKMLAGGTGGIPMAGAGLQFAQISSGVSEWIDNAMVEGTLAVSDEEEGRNGLQVVKYPTNFIEQAASYSGATAGMYEVGKVGVLAARAAFSPDVPKTNIALMLLSQLGPREFSKQAERVVMEGLGDRPEPAHVNR